MVDVEIKLDRYDRCYFPGDTVSGVVIVRSDSKISHQGISLNVEGAVNLVCFYYDFDFNLFNAYHLFLNSN